MNFLKRWTLSLITSFDSVMSQVENHEALVGAALREMKEAAAKARGQLHRVRRDGERMTTRLNEVTEQIIQWEERAVREAANDHARALECIKRKNACVREKASLEKQLQEHRALCEHLTRDLQSIEERITQLSQKRNILAAKESRTQVLKASEGVQFGLIGEIDDIFERWEMRLQEYETVTPITDEFAAGFEREEARNELERELAELLRKNQPEPKSA